jgi:hypothetical protein
MIKTLKKNKHLCMKRAGFRNVGALGSPLVVVSVF